MPFAIDSLFSEGPHTAIWSAISQNRQEDALNMIRERLEEVPKSFWRFLKKADRPDTAILRIADNILSHEKWKPLSDLSLTIKQAGELHFAEIIKLLVALHANSHYTSALNDFSQQALAVLKKLSEEVRQQSGEYPENTIAGYVWISGYSIRVWSTQLAIFFHDTANLTDKAVTMQYKCQITASLMSHYPETLGPDMIATAAALEDIDETEIPHRYYTAIIQDFQPMADNIKKQPAEGVSEEDIITLTALKQAYEGIERLTGLSQYSRESRLITDIIEQGVTYIPDNTEDDD